MRRVLLLCLAAGAGAFLALSAPAAAEGFQVNAGSDRPGGVTVRRFLTLADRAGAHWGASYRGRTGHRPGVADGHNVVGFSRGIDPGAGGATYCFDGVLHRHARGLHEHCSERDILINPRVKWEQGPRHPASDEYDLQTVLLHEFGHFSGWWPREGRRCTNSPMASPLYNGEWWRSRRDYHWRGCGGRSSGAGRGSEGLVPLEL